MKLEVFDFADHNKSYALQTGKNKFGYLHQSDYYIGKKKIYEGPKYDNVIDNGIYWLAFGVNVDQMKSLKSKINSVEKNEKLLNIIEDEDAIKYEYSRGSCIYYHGNYKEDFCSNIASKEKIKKI